jgi:hypothetical protein
MGHLGTRQMSIHDNRLSLLHSFPHSFVRNHLLPTVPLLRFDLVALGYSSSRDALRLIRVGGGPTPQCRRRRCPACWVAGRHAPYRLLGGGAFRSLPRLLGGGATAPLVRQRPASHRLLRPAAAAPPLHLLGSRRRHFPRARRVGGDASLIPRVRLSRVYSKSHFWFSGTTFMVVPRQPGPGWHAGKSACRFLWATCDTDKYNGSEVTGVVSPSERRARPVDLMRPFSMSRSSSRFHRRASPSRHHKLIVAMFSCSLSRISCIILSEFSAGNDESSELLPWSFDSPGYLLSEK